MSSFEIVLLRHGESTWNEKNLFCGWFDADLSEEGKDEARRAGEALKKANIQFDCAHTSLLTRARKTLQIVLGVIGQSNIPVYETWRLNERFYGGLTGLNKTETAIKYGEMQVQIWRRSFDVPPPAMDENHPYYSEIVHDPRYAKGPPKDEFPLTESLKMTIERTLPYWNNVIVPQIREGKKILIVAHGNSLRGIVKTLEDLSEETIMQLNLPTGIPFTYTLDKNIKPRGSLNFLAEDDVVRKAMELVAAQAKVK